MSDTPVPTPPDTLAASHSPSSSTEELEIAQIVAERYRIETRIGEGGMGSVYRATHITMGHPVAIKVLHKDLAKDVEFTQRFHREAQAASAIQHPNICGATDFGSLPSGAPYMVMEYLAGETLEALMQREVVVPLKETLHIVTQVVSVLQEAHANGIVHRDLKPENIMLVTRAGMEGVVKVMDFGIASIQDGQRLSPETRITRAGIAYGTPAYMSPEQVSGEPVIDGRADLYSLGIMMFEMLTGTPPFEGNNVAAIMAKHLTATPTSLRARTPQANIPQALDDIVLKLLEKEPDARFASADDLLIALTNLTQSMTPAADASQSQHLTVATQSVSNSRPLLLIAIPLGALLVLAMVVMVVVAATQPPAAEQPIEVTQSSPPEVIKQSIEVSRRQFVAKHKGLNELIVQMAAGQQKEALIALREREDELGESPHYHYYMALAHEGNEDIDAASPHYSSAVVGDERYLQDTQVIEHFAELAASRKGSRQKLFTAAIESFPSLLTPIMGQIAEIAADPKAKRKEREHARDVLLTHEHLAKLPTWQRATIELEHHRKCAPRIAAIKTLGDDGSEQAAATLKRWKKKPRSGCSGSSLLSKINKDKDCFACLRAPLKKALGKFDAPDPK